MQWSDLGPIKGWYRLAWLCHPSYFTISRFQMKHICQILVEKKLLKELQLPRNCKCRWNIEKKIMTKLNRNISPEKNVNKCAKNRNSSGCKSEILNNGCALKSLSCESKEKVGSFWKVKLCTPCAPDFALGQGINKLGSCNLCTLTHSIHTHWEGGKQKLWEELKIYSCCFLLCMWHCIQDFHHPHHHHH